MKLFVAFLIVWVLMPGVSYAQKVIYNFERLTTEDGLPSNNILDILQDRQGFLWFGTDKGLCRFDGIRMKTFVHDTDNPRSISSNLVKRLYEGRDGKIWIASLQTGLSVYDPRLPDDEAFTNYRSNLNDSSTLRNNEIYAVYEDDRGFIWVAGLDTDLQRLDPKTGKFESIVLGANKTIPKSFFCFIEDPDRKHLWLASRYDGFFRLDLATHEAKNYSYASLAGSTENSVGGFAFTQGKLWVSYYNLGVGVLDLKTDTFTPDVFHLGRNVDFYDNTIFSLGVGPDNTLWSGHGSKGIYLYNLQTKAKQRIGWKDLTPGDTLGVKAEVIFFDRDAIGWIGTSGKGLLKYDPNHNQFNVFNSFTDQRQFGKVLQLVEAGDYIFFHTQTGVGKYNTISRKTEWFLPYRDKKIDAGQLNLIHGRLYVSSRNNGLWYVDEKQGRLIKVTATGDDVGFNSADVNTVIQERNDGDSVLWVGSWGGGLYRYHEGLGTVTRFSSKDGVPDDKVLQIAEDPRGYLWLSTQGHGVACVRDRKKMNFEVFVNNPHVSESLPSNTVHCFYSDLQNRFWMGTTVGGIVEVKEVDHKLVFHHIKDDKRLSFQGIHEIVQGKHDQLMLLTENGLAVVDPVAGVVNHQDEEMESYSSAFPITTIAIYKGNILLGTDDGFLSASSAELPSVGHRPAVISGLRIFDRDQSHLLRSRNLVLPYDQNFLTIEFTVPQFSETKNTTFAYRLVGVDKEWRFTNKDASAEYTDIAGGNYVFQVKASGRDGKWNDAVSTLAFAITPPYWATIWFRILVVMLIAATIYAIHRYRMRQLLIIQNIRNNISKDLHDDVGATLSSIRILSEVAHQKLKDNPEYASELMAKVSMQAADMADSMSDIIWTFNPYNDHLEKMVQRLQLQFHDLCEARGIQLLTSISTQAISISLNLDVRKNIYLICKEAIHNAIKSSGGNLVKFSVAGGIRQLRIDITDNGKGFVADAVVSGNGLRNMKLRAAEIRAEIDITSSPAGTSIKIIFNPLRHGYKNLNL